MTSCVTSNKQCITHTAGINEEVSQSSAAGVPLTRGPARVVHVQRRADIEAVRSGLPITGMEQEVMEAVLQHDVVVLCGETGCGKTTQVGASCRLQLCFCAIYHCSHTGCSVMHTAARIDLTAVNVSVTCKGDLVVLVCCCKIKHVQRSCCSTDM